MKKIAPMLGKGKDSAGRSGLADRELWRRSQLTDAPTDEAGRLLDLAAFAEGRLDDEDTARVAALLLRDADAAQDVAAARLLADAAAAPADADVVTRAVALVGAERASAAVIRFPAPGRRAPWFEAARWGSLAAAIMLAGWLGFDLGAGVYTGGAAIRAGDDVSATELMDTGPLMLRDFSENS
ncbi:MAG: hypothetical protein JO032_12370 [Alphaproteobacteria bacterium]|nr:hypothetical protein [Alphaproteobacteria bacterium]